MRRRDMLRGAIAGLIGCAMPAGLLKDGGGWDVWGDGLAAVRSSTHPVYLHWVPPGIPRLWDPPPDAEVWIDAEWVSVSEVEWTDDGPRRREA